MHAVAETRRAPPAGTPPRKPLYLATSGRLRVTAQAGSLVVQRPSMSDRRFPLARIDRIVCNSRDDWTGEALALCMASGVTITWISGRGDALGQCTPRLPAPASLQTRLECFLERPDWAARYGNWLRGRRMRMLVDWATARALDGAVVTAGEWERRKREYVYGGVITQVFDDEAKGWCYGWVVSRLHEAGLAIRYWGYDASSLELAEDVGDLLWGEVNLAAGTLVEGAIGSEEWLLFFENWTRLHRDRTADHLAQLNRFVAGENDAWR